MKQLIDDHVVLLDQLRKKDVDGVCDTIRRHLSRLDDTITEIHRTHSSYFDS